MKEDAQVSTADSSKRIHEIDGLRAIALLGVLIYHGRFEIFMSGGFLGVDVFFVISGYVITLSLLKQFQKGTFSFREFLIRRILRLVPALLATLFFTNIFVMFLTTRKQRWQAANMSVSSIFSVSNIHLWMQSSYFDVSSRQKPYLHTWSLSVEWQFYITWALLARKLLTRFPSKRIQMGIISVVTVTSIGATEVTRTQFPSAAFYNVIFRYSEFMCGALPAWHSFRIMDEENVEDDKLESSKALKIGLSSALSALCLGSVAILMNFFKDTFPFPGSTALPICIATSIIISKSPGTIVSSILSNKIIQWLGEISYSVYLVHWPVQVLLNFETLHHSSKLLNLIGTIFSVFLGHVLNRTVEKPFQETRAKQTKLNRVDKLRILGGFMVLFLSQAFYMHRDDIPISPKRKEVTEFIRNSWIYAESRGEEIRPKCRSIGRHDNLRHWKKCNRETEIAFALLGDSHAADLWYALNSTYPDINTYEICGTGCGLTRNPEEWTGCYKIFHAYQEKLKKHQKQIKAVFLVSHWHAEKLESLRNTYLSSAIDYFHENTKAKIFLFGARPAFKPHPNEVFERSGFREEVDTLEKKSNAFKWIEEGSDRALYDYAQEKNVEFVSVPHLMCNATYVGQDSSEYFCPTVDREAMASLYCDYTHYNQLGAKKLIRMLKPKIDSILETSNEGVEDQTERKDVDENDNIGAATINTQAGENSALLYKKELLSSNSSASEKLEQDDRVQTSSYIPGNSSVSHNETDMTWRDGLENSLVNASDGVKDTT